MRMRNTHGRVGLGIVVACLAIMLLGAACSSGDGGGASPAGASTATLAMKNFAFTPTTLNVHSGKTAITITNNGSVQHTFTLNDGSVDQVVNPGQTLTVTVDLTADTAFHCRFHPTLMKGTLNLS